MIWLARAVQVAGGMTGQVAGRLVQWADAATGTVTIPATAAVAHLASTGPRLAAQGVANALRNLVERGLLQPLDGAGGGTTWPTVAGRYALTLP